MGEDPRNLGNSPDVGASADPRKRLTPPLPGTPVENITEQRDSPGSIPRAQWDRFVQEWVKQFSKLIILNGVVAELLAAYSRILADHQVVQDRIELAELKREINELEAMVREALSNSIGRSPWEGWGLLAAPKPDEDTAFDPPGKPEEGTPLGPPSWDGSGVTNIGYVVTFDPTKGSQPGSIAPREDPQSKGDSDDAPSHTSSSDQSDRREPRHSDQAQPAQSSKTGTGESTATTAKSDKKPDTDKSIDPKGKPKGLPPDPSMGHGGRSADDLGARMRIPPLPLGVTKQDLDLVGPFVETKTGPGDEIEPEVTTTPSAAASKDPNDLGDDLRGDISGPAGVDAGKLKIEDPRPLNPIDPSKV